MGCILMAASFCMCATSEGRLISAHSHRGCNLGAYRPHTAVSIRGALVSSIRRYLLGLADTRARPGESNPQLSFTPVRKAEVTSEVTVMIVGITGPRRHTGRWWAGSQIMNSEDYSQIQTLSSKRGGGAYSLPATSNWNKRTNVPEVAETTKMWIFHPPTSLFIKPWTHQRAGTISI